MVRHAKENQRGCFREQQQVVPRDSFPAFETYKKSYNREDPLLWAEQIAKRLLKFWRIYEDPC